MKQYKLLIIILCLAGILLMSSTAFTDAIPHAEPQSTQAPSTHEQTTALLHAAQVCHDIYAASEKGDSMNVVLDEETIREMVDAVAVLGFSVIDENMSLDMRNPEPLMAFGSGASAEAVYFTIYSDGHIGMNVLKDDRLFAASASFIDMPEVYLANESALTQVRYTEKGWLIYRRDMAGVTNAKSFNLDAYTMVRVTPLSDELRKLCETYIEPVGYSENNLFTVNWSNTDYTQLDFASLYAMLFGMNHEGETLTWYSAKAYYDQLPNSELFLIPQSEFESITQQYLNADTSVLRRTPEYNATKQGYYFLGWQTGYYDVVPRLPVSEVVDAWENADGTVTMQVDALFSWYGTDRAFTHEITVQPNADGSFRYIANRVIAREDNIFPERQLSNRRNTMISQLDE